MKTFVLGLITLHYDLHHPTEMLFIFGFANAKTFERVFP